MSIDAVIFDFGGVILDIDYEATSLAMHHLLGSRAPLVYTKVKQSPIFDQLETGVITPQEFYARLSQEVGRALDPHDIDRAWNAMLGRTRRERIDFLKRVSRYRRIFLLSNTNAIHKAAFDRILKEDLEGESFDGLFEKAYYSHQMGLRKPQAEIFRYLIETHGLDPARTLFIDDSEANIRGAAKVGLETFHLQVDLMAAPLTYLEDPLH